MVIGAVVLILILAALLAGLIAVDRRPHPAVPNPAVPFPWLWGLPAVVVTGLSVLIGAARYPALPDQIPVHFDFHGVADRFVATTPFTAFFPIIVQVLLTAILAASAALVLRTPAGGARRAPAAIALLLLAAAMDLANLLLAQPVWRGQTTLPAGTTVGAGLCVAAGMVAVVVASLPTRRAADADGAAPGDADRDAHWRGFFYVNRRDRALFVPKRFGIGWTVNLGRPAGWAVLAALICIPVLSAILGHHAA